MAVRKYEFSGRADAFDLRELVKRHFGTDAKVSKGDDGRMRVSLTVLPTLSKMAGFLTEVRRLGVSAYWDAPNKEFVISQSVLALVELPLYKNRDLPKRWPKEEEYKTPFTVKLAAYRLFGLENHKALVQWATESKLKKAGKVKLSSLIATQTEVYGDNFLEMIELLKDGKQLDPILVMRVGNTYVIVDGHHRAAAVYSMGGTTINAIIANPK